MGGDNLILMVGLSEYFNLKLPPRNIIIGDTVEIVILSLYYFTIIINSFKNEFFRFALLYTRVTLGMFADINP